MIFANFSDYKKVMQKTGSTSLSNDEVTLVSESDEVTGRMDKFDAHRWPAQLHRAASVFLFRKNPDNNALELFMQQRSAQKIVGAHQWANTICGNVWPGETYEECARRRLKDELGISEHMPLEDIFTFRYQVQCNEEYGENEIDHIFVGWFDGETNLNPEQVQAIDWVDYENLQSWVNTHDCAPWFLMMLDDESLMSALKEKVK